MAEKIQAKVIDAEEPSIQEKEETVQKNAGFDEESGVYKVDLSKPPVTKEQPKQMPFKSKAQMRFLYKTNPKLAEKWSKKYKTKNLPEKVMKMCGIRRKK